jgi:hypothetical protein
MTSVRTILAAFAFTAIAAAQAVFPTTTLKVALTGWPSATQPQLVVYLTSTAAYVPGQLPVSNSGIGDPSGHTSQILMVDREAMCIDGPIQPDGGLPVERGCQGSYMQGHAAGATVYVGFPSYYAWTVPSGACNAPTLPVLPTVYIQNAGVYNCIGGTWVYTGQVSGAGPWYSRFGHWVVGH